MGLVPTITIAIILGPFMEEVIFRGFAQERFSKITNDLTALIASSTIFAAVHWNPGVSFIVGVDLFLLFFDSIWFGLIFMKSRNTLLSTLCHSLGNFIFILYGILVVGIVI